MIVAELCFCCANFHFILQHLLSFTVVYKLIMNFFFVRHTSVDVPPGVCYGQTDVPLKSTFLKEAEVVKSKLEEIEAAECGFDSVYCSPLQRCRILADYCGYDSGVSPLYKSSVVGADYSQLQESCVALDGSLQLQNRGVGERDSPHLRCGRECIIERRVMEINFGEWEMHSFDSIKDPRLQEWYNDYLHVSATGGESFQQQYNRVSSFINETVNCSVPRRNNILLFTHGGVIACAQLYAGLIKPEQVFSLLSPYGSIIKITF